MLIPKRKSIAFRHLEFMPLSERRILVIIVATDGHVQNCIITPEKPFAASELTQASNFFNQHYSGLTFEQVQARLHEELKQMQSDMTRLMAAALEASDRALHKSRDAVVISGEHNLLQVDDSPPMSIHCASYSKYLNAARS